MPPGPVAEELDAFRHVNVGMRDAAQAQRDDRRPAGNFLEREPLAHAVVLARRVSALLVDQPADDARRRGVAATSPGDRKLVIGIRAAPPRREQ